MATVGGNGRAAPDPLRRLRRDDGRLGAGPDPLGRRYSGRRFVIGGAMALMVLWGTLSGAFLAWRARYEALRDFGARRIASQVEPLAGEVPPGVSPASWRGAVADTRAMLDAVTASGLLDRPAMERLGDDLRARVGRVRGHPELARTELRRLWDEMEARAGPVLTRPSSRPPHCPRRPSLLARHDGP